MTNIHSRSRTLLPAALALIVASWGAMAAPPDKESPIDKDPSTQMTPPVPPKASTAPSPSVASTVLSSDMRMQFDARDTNRDGYIDKSEAGTDRKLLSQFNALDVDKDGKLSAIEFGNAKNLAKLTIKNNGTDRQ